ncbi:MAG: sulfatase-like hydrolase/transferase [candidate division KSB1 bacterium]|nr:sulfatase-like hydrolase/transferase [candidate division KSB1 bacterium]
MSRVNRRQFLKFAAAGTVLFPTANTLTGCAGCRRPNIIFFIADDMLPEMFNFLPEGRGKNLTPNLDRLAREGTIMMNQYVASPVCTPSRYNCLTGRYASRARNESFLQRTRREKGQTVIQWNSFITERDSTLPKILQANGYTTGMVGKNHVIHVNNYYQFPDYNADPKAPKIAAKLRENSENLQAAVKQAGFDYAERLYHNNPNFIGLADVAVQNLDWITEGGLLFIESNRNTPFFLYFATTVPHQPNEPERSWNANPLVTAQGILESPPEGMPPRETIARRIKKAGLEGTGRENLLWLDDALGALLDKLCELNLDNDTLLFFFNDHGQHDKGTLYQGGVRTPSVVWKKGGFECGEVSTTRVSNVDFAPTILDYTNSRYDPNMFDGTSFRSVLQGRSKIIHDRLYFELGYSRGLLMGDWKYIALRYPDYAENRTFSERKQVLDAYNRGREFRNMKIVNRDPSKPYSHLEIIPGGGHAEHESYGKRPGYFDSDQLYNISEDPGETNNLAQDPTYQTKLTEMQQALDEMTDDLPGAFKI